MRAIPTLAPPDPVRLAPEAGRRWVVAASAVAIAAAAASIAGAVPAPRRFAFSYLTAFVFVLSLGVGGLFWTMLHHLSGAGWSVVVRRFPEHFARALPWMAPLFIPVVWGTGALYGWADSRSAADPVWEARRPWLNAPFFWGRAAVYLAVWGLLGTGLARLSARQDESRDPELTCRMQRLSAVGAILLALTTTFAAFDWLMALDERWYSTMFGVYFWAGSILGSLAALVVTVLGFRAGGHLEHTITIEHLHDLGKLMFGFVIFWAYIAFAQYFLVWYADQPEEIAWYLRRRSGSWNVLSWALAIGHFAIPFALLMPRTWKRNPRLLGAVACWLLVVHYLDLYWLVMPTLDPDGVRPHWLDLTTLIALVAAFVAVVARACARYPLVPVGDPRLTESLVFRNV